jgi:hypothetical protein
MLDIPLATQCAPSRIRSADLYFIIIHITPSSCALVSGYWLRFDADLVHLHLSRSDIVTTNNFEVSAF